MNEHKYSKLHDLIAVSASEVIEKMFYKTLTPVDEDIMFNFEVVVTISFKGKYDGTFWIVLGKQLCYELSASFLSMNAEDLDDELVHDTTKEIINMVCGNVLFNFDKQKKFDITIPSIFVDTNAQSQILTMPRTTYPFSFRIGKHPLKMILALKMGDIDG
ncbi:MAG: hypothetical protein DKM50_11960 [Candidatus Margulisiibacteriota bacterium]|nr:MAG: hypothetical protein A2X43_04620 [Candidatus Margulisbacteria bacterium GWD2_39_127]OGI01572.1 MAG: hypothetical protein A2X42_08330 [Candidatus Margulisbacteria bacterium GWF2_38_17]OGI10014.1 MAG: hypothetical protein A2X41_09040 [Candidatus Margulisbacteria bacterium GWE2_39_32]PZM78269.1 MAG: hypothetical protein DKM50_11960 [Candidatus Margulisiibacteriota bacterium]HAR61843.1 hypothetical protein [Candidatus Margulisiibacteriota bacterium]